MEIQKVLAMAIDAVAEENGVSPKQIIVRSFNEIQTSSLEKYIKDNNISYHKYQLEDSRA